MTTLFGTHHFKTAAELKKLIVKRKVYVRLSNRYFIHAAKTDLYSVFKAMKTQRTPIEGRVDVSDSLAYITF